VGVLLGASPLIFRARPGVAASRAIRKMGEECARMASFSACSFLFFLRFLSAPWRNFSGVKTEHQSNVTCSKKNQKQC